MTRPNNRRRRTGYCYNLEMRWFSWLGVLVVFLAIVGLILSALPVQEKSVTIPFSLEDGQRGELTLVTPEWLKVGEVSKIALHISFDPDQQALLDPSRMEIVSRLDFGMLEFSPKGESRVLINPAKTLTMLWTLQPDKSMNYAGELWLLRETQTGESELILAREVILEARNILGMSYFNFRWIVFCALLVGILLIWPLLNGLARKALMKVAAKLEAD